MSAGLNVARDGAVLTLTIDRPDRRNALDVATYAALSEQLTLAGGDQTLAAVILTGAGATSRPATTCATSRSNAAPATAPA